MTAERFPETKGRGDSTTCQASRFVVLRHEMPGNKVRPLHWDFMIEVEGTLRTWALDREPAEGLSIHAQALADHRLAYLDYEGPVSGDRGLVTPWDRGTCRIVKSDAAETRVALAGAKLIGQVHLARRPEAGHWTFTFVSGRSATVG